jgi:hypothetical protein
MKKKILFVGLLCMLVWACTNEDQPNNDASSSEQSAVAYEPYISPQMQQTLTMLDTCTTPIPIEKLIPYVNKIDTSSQKTTKEYVTRASDDGTTVVTGYYQEQILFTNTKVTISDDQTSVFCPGYAAGDYYATCYAVTYYLRCNNSGIEELIETNDTIGINPDNENSKGYHIQTLSVGTKYLFTTYFWFIWQSNKKDAGFYIPFEYTDAYGFSRMQSLDDYLPEIQWRFIAL